jgi:hypothetical protein
VSLMVVQCSYFMSSILLTWCNQFYLYCATLFSTGSNLSSSKISSFLLWSCKLYIERIVLLDVIHRLVSQKNWGIRIYIQKNHNTHVQNSHKGQLLATEPLTWAHTHINPWSKSDTGGNKWPSHCTLHS